MGASTNQTVTNSNTLSFASSFLFLVLLFMFINISSSTYNPLPSNSFPQPRHHETLDSQESKNVHAKCVTKRSRDHEHDQSSSSCTTTTTTQTARDVDDHHDQYQVFYVKNTPPFLLDKERSPPNTKINYEHIKRKRSKVKEMKKKKKKKKKRSRKIINNDSKSNPFAVMLPKGFVPPSGSSHCHNFNPNFKATFYCELSSTTKP